MLRISFLSASLLSWRCRILSHCAIALLLVSSLSPPIGLRRSHDAEEESHSKHHGETSAEVAAEFPGIDKRYREADGRERPPEEVLGERRADGTAAAAGEVLREVRRSRALIGFQEQAEKEKARTEAEIEETKKWIEENDKEDIDVDAATEPANAREKQCASSVAAVLLVHALLVPKAHERQAPLSRCRGQLIRGRLLHPEPRARGRVSGSCHFPQSTLPFFFFF